MSSRCTVVQYILMGLYLALIPSIPKLMIDYWLVACRAVRVYNVCDLEFY